MLSHKIIPQIYNLNDHCVVLFHNTYGDTTVAVCLLAHFYILYPLFYVSFKAPELLLHYKFVT